MRSLLLVAVLLPQASVNAQVTRDPAYVVSAPGADRFALSVGGRPAPLVVDARDHAGVIRAARSLGADLGRVTGAEAVVRTDGAAGASTVLLIGTVGKSPLIDGLVQARKLDVAGIVGRWEAFVTQIVERPMAGVERALVIAGSDKRGTIYGIYDLSAQIGVSPWYWWADVPVRRQTELYVLPGRHTQGEPAVKYRGFFINDEAPALSGWTNARFGGFNHKLYENVFELLLRMKGNYLWPAMWGNAFYDDDPLNPQLADEYGVVIGTSHHEPLMRAHDEWRRYGTGAWNYQTNAEVLKEFWRASIRRMGTYESIVTVGMRGDGDEPMSQDRNIALLEQIVTDQRAILADVTGKDAAATPQIWALYKEVQDYYDRGMRVPEDVTLLFADDNWGNIRRLPKAGDAPRAGGYGVYYHFDYVGGPRNYKWVNTNQIERVWEQMHHAYRLGADRIWIVNVGDIKPMEFPLEFFLDYAWNPDRWPAERLPEYTRRWAERQFGAQQATAIAEILERYTKYNARRKPELLSPETYSLTHYREAERVIADYNELVTRAERIHAQLPVEYRDAFYQLVLHPVQASANINELYVTVGRNRLYAKQGRALTNALADRAAELFARDAQISAYYNDTLAGGKWKHMMDQTHIGYTYWQQPPVNAMPAVTRIEVPAAAELGVAIEGSDAWWPGASAASAQSQTAPQQDPMLPELDVYTQQSVYIDVFNRGATAFNYAVETGVAWLRVTPARGAVEQQQRLQVSADWQRAPIGKRSVSITITGPRDQRVIVHVPISNPATPRPDAVTGFMETNGYVSIEAEHYTRAVAIAPVEWIRIPNLGRTLSAMTALPVTSRVTRPGGASPHLEYRVFLIDSGTVSIHAFLSPSLDVTDLKGLRYGISLDDEPPQIIDMLADTSLRAWERAVSNNVRMAASQHRVSGAGEHVLKFWLVDPGVVLQKLVVDAGGLEPSYLGPPESFRGDASPSAATSRSSNARASDPRFDWFTYEGSDPVYRQVRADTGSYLNPILPGFYPDPSMTRVGDDYYLVTSSFSYFPGIPLFHSRDLVHWTQLGHVLDRPSQLPLDTIGISRGVFAPAITHHNGTFYVITTLVDAGGNMLVTAANPAGPWSDPVWLNFDGIDPSLFFDDDGRAYVVNNGPPIGAPLYNGHRALWMQEYDPKAQKMIGERKLIVNGGVDIARKPIWIEAPHILKVNGTYYLIAAEGGTAEDHSEVVFRAKSVWGPWEPYTRNPILTQRHLDPKRPFPITSTGHASFVQTPSGEWWGAFLGVRPYQGDHYNNGRETYLLPVEWRDGWPHMLSGDATVPYVVRRPNLPRHAPAAALKAGNFVEREDFTDTQLKPYWVFIRTPREQWHDLTATPGWLTIRARPAHIGKLTQPSFIGRRQQHAYATVTTALHYSPEREGDRAGLAAFHTENFYYLFVVALVDGKRVIQLEKSRGANSSGAPEVLASTPLTQAPGGALYLKIDANGASYDFAYGYEPDRWITLKGGVDGTHLSTKVAGSFVGTMFGMYAYTEPASSGAPRLPRIFQDGMVLQRDVRVPVWGWAAPGSPVSVTLASRTERAVADDGGGWAVQFPALRASGPYTLAVEAGGTVLTIRDIVVGDVWIASGQSNMEWSLGAATNGAAAAAAAQDPLLREFSVPHGWSETPEQDLEGGSWARADAQHAGRFSAVAYFFARDLRVATDVPIGIIHTSWGGSNIETWMSRPALELSDSAWNAIVQRERARDEANRAALRSRIGSLPTTDAGLVDGRAVWADPALDDTGWDMVPVPSLWEQAGYPGMDGIAWYRTTFSLTAEEARQGARISLGMIDDDDITWINGNEIGRTTGYATRRIYTVPASALRAGSNLLAVRVVDGGGGGGPYGDASQYYLEVGSVRRPLAATWKFKVGAVSFQADGQRINKIPTVLYNRMLHPLLRYPIKGVIWYQGESNANNDEQAAAYRPLFANLIQGWRREWRSDFPFLWVQLPNFGTIDTVPPARAAWATLRESQTAALSLPNTGQVIAIDIGDPRDIHPRDKEPVGSRLALTARRIAYGETIVASGPTYHSHAVRDGRIVIEFDNIGGGLVPRADTAVRGFAIAGADRRWVWADARIDGDRVVVSSPQVPSPVAVRYAWSNSPREPSLYNREGLPAAPFRTDQW